MKHSEKDTLILYFPDTGGYNFTPPYELLFQYEALKTLPYKIILADSRVCDVKEILKTQHQNICLFVVSSIIKYTSVSISKQYQDCIKISEFVASQYSIPIAWTGLIPTSLGQNTIAKNYIKYIIQGQSEDSLKDILTAMYEGKPIQNSENVTFINESQILFNNLKNHDNIFKKYGNFDLYSINLDNYIHNHTIDYVASTGCVNHCHYCSVPTTYDGRWQHNDAENIINHLQFILKHAQIKNIHFRDDNFLVNKKFATEIFEALNKKNLEFSWSAQTSINMLSRYTDSELDKLHNFGCNNISVGIESGDAHILDNLASAKTTIKNTIYQIKRLIKAGISPSVTSIVGFPYNKVRDYNKTLKLLMRIKLLYPDLSLYCTVFQPIPGTKAFNDIFDKTDTIYEFKDYNTWVTKAQREKLKKFEMVYFTFCNLNFYKKLPPESSKRIKYVNILLWPFIRLRFHFRVTDFLWEHKIASFFLKKYLHSLTLNRDKGMSELGIRHHNTNYNFGY